MLTFGVRLKFEVFCSLRVDTGLRLSNQSLRVFSDSVFLEHRLGLGFVNAVRLKAPIVLWC